MDNNENLIITAKYYLPILKDYSAVDQISKFKNLLINLLFSNGYELLFINDLFLNRYYSNSFKLIQPKQKPNFVKDFFKKDLNLDRYTYFLNNTRSEIPFKIDVIYITENKSIIFEFNVFPTIYYKINQLHLKINDLTEIRNKSLQECTHFLKLISGGLALKEMEPPHFTQNLIVDNILDKLHPKILAVSESLFKDKHYSQAIFEATKKIELMVKEKSKLDSSGADLMRKVFSSSKPILKVNNLNNKSDLDEQQGIMHLFEGLILGLKNPKSHSNIIQNDIEKTLDYLRFCSLLAKIVDESECCG